MMSPKALERQIVMMEDNDMQDQCFVRLDEKHEANNMSNTSLSALSESTSHDENDYDGSEFLDTENVGIVSPVKEEENTVNVAAPTKKEAPKPKKAVPVPVLTKSCDDPTEVGVPSKFDVLCGQSRICASHTGNRRFQIVLDIYAPKYEGAKSKQEKMMLTKEIVACIGTSGGRFLKYKDGVWCEISNVTARDKVSHALRTKVQSWKKQQAEKKTGVTPTKRRKSETAKRIRRRASTNSPMRRSASSVVSGTSTSKHIHTVSFDGSTTSSTNIMDELLRTQREIFANLTQSDKGCQPHPLKTAQSWS